MLFPAQEQVATLRPFRGTVADGRRADRRALLRGAGPGAGQAGRPRHPGRAGPPPAAPRSPPTRPSWQRGATCRCLFRHRSGRPRAACDTSLTQPSWSRSARLGRRGAVRRRRRADPVPGRGAVGHDPGRLRRRPARRVARQPARAGRCQRRSQSQTICRPARGPRASWRAWRPASLARGAFCRRHPQRRRPRLHRHQSPLGRAGQHVASGGRSRRRLAGRRDRTSPPPAQVPGRRGVATGRLLLAVLGAARHQHERARSWRNSPLPSAIGGAMPAAVKSSTPLRHDLRTAVPVAAAAAAALALPSAWRWFSSDAVD